MKNPLYLMIFDNIVFEIFTSIETVVNDGFYLFTCLLPVLTERIQSKLIKKI